MVSISNSVAACILCFLCSGCQKRDVSRICKEIQASCLTDQTYTSLFDEDLHEFGQVDEVNVVDNQATNAVQLENNERK